MKKIFLILVIIFFSVKLNAQDFPPAGGYIVNNNMSAFHGTWQWVNGIDTFKIYLTTEKIFYNINSGFNWDKLVGWHIYKSGNVIIESSYNNINNVAGRTFTGSNEADSFHVLSDGTFKDISKNKLCNVTLTLNATETEMIWKLESKPGIKIKGPNDPPFQSGFTLPKNMVLIKQ